MNHGYDSMDNWATEIKEKFQWIPLIMVTLGHTES